MVTLTHSLNALVESGKLDEEQAKLVRPRHFSGRHGAPPR
jgi:hypothetical protein